MSSTEFMTEKKGKREDAGMHGPILDNLKANEETSTEAVEVAVARGLPREDAELIYGS